jgi:hypothetical protein
MKDFPNLASGKEKMCFEQFLVYHMYFGSSIHFRNMALNNMTKEYKAYLEGFAK